MLGVSNQYLLSFKLNGESLDIKESDFHSIKVIEETGNMLPSMELVFILRETNLIYKFREGSIILVELGSDGNRRSNYQFSIINRVKLEEYNNYILLKIIGISSSLSYSIGTYVKSFPKYSSLDIISNIVSRYFKFSTNIKSRPTDYMNWVQSNVSDRKMVTKVWLHSKFNDNNLAMVGITAFGEFRLRGLKETISGADINTWTFTPEPTGIANTVVYTRQPELVSSPGSSDAIYGFAKSRIIHNLDTNEIEYSQPNNLISIASTEYVETQQIDSKLSTVSVINSNVHKDYYVAKDYNICNLNRLQGFRVKVTSSGEFFNISVLDKAVIATGNPLQGFPNNDMTGNYIVDKVCRVIANRRITTIVTLVRDSMNQTWGQKDND